VAVRFLATGPTTGVYYPLGGGVANVLSKYVPGYAANAETTAGSVANLKMRWQKKSDLAFSLADAAWDVFKGQGRITSRGSPGWLIEMATVLERTLLVAAGLLFVHPRPLFDAAGFVLLGVALALQWRRRRRAALTTLRSG